MAKAVTGGWARTRLPEDDRNNRRGSTKLLLSFASHNTSQQFQVQ